MPAAKTNAAPAPKALSLAANLPPAVQKKRMGDEAAAKAKSELKPDASGLVEVNLDQPYIVQGTPYGPGPTVMPLEDAEHVVGKMARNKVGVQFANRQKEAELRRLKELSQIPETDDDDDDDEEEG